eukprot:6695907-Pyramimonas_sp.AAC.1
MLAHGGLNAGQPSIVEKVADRVLAQEFSLPAGGAEGGPEARGHGAPPVGTARWPWKGEELRHRQDPEGTVREGDGVDAWH